MLLEERLVSPAQLEEALETQVVHGGRLGTNLVEHGFLKEADLARVLGRLHGLPYASGEMVPDPAALKVADARFYDEHELLPMRIDATRLTVAVLGPGQLQAIDTLAFRAGKRVVQVVIPEFRMNQLLRRHCKAFRPIRPIDMHALRPSSRKVQEGPALADASELINESDFAKIYANAMVGRDVGAGAPVELDDPIVEGVLEATPPVPKASPAEAPEVELAPLSFSEAQAALKTSVDRDDIARTVLRFARTKFRRSLLLVVHGDLVTGWHGLGGGITTRAVRRIGVSLREDNTFRLVRDLRSHFIGPMKRSAGMGVFYQMLGGDYPTTAVVLPLLVRGKPVNLLYLDEGPGRVTPPEVGELLIVSQSVTRSYELLIRQRKAPPPS